MRHLSTVVVIATKDLALRLRDRSAWVTAFVAPLALAAIISMALGGVGRHPHVTVAVVDDDHGALAKVFVNAVAAPPLRALMTVTPVPSIAVAEDRVRTGAVNAAIIIPAGFSNQAALDPPRLAVVARPDQLLGEGIARSISDAFMTRTAAARLAVVTTVALSPTTLDQAAIAAIARRAVAAETRDPLVNRTPGRAVPPAAYYAPAMGILFLFFVAGFGARSFLVEQRDNTMSRLMAAPIPAWTIVLGKALATFALGMGSMIVLYASSSLLFHAHWGSPVAVLALSAGIVVAIMALTAFVTTLAKTDDQANGYAGFMTFVLGLLGGNFIATYQLPPTLRTISTLTPNGWALRGFADLGAGVASLHAVAPPLIAVGAFAAVFGALALSRSHRLVRA
ncbi:MAG: ABC transporter permease [Acidimicrobiales bacterium]